MVASGESAFNAEACLVEVELILEAAKHIVADETTVTQFEQGGPFSGECVQVKACALVMGRGWSAGRLAGCFEAMLVEMDQIFDVVLIVVAGAG